MCTCVHICVNNTNRVSKVAAIARKITPVDFLCPCCAYDVDISLYVIDNMQRAKVGVAASVVSVSMHTTTDTSNPQ